ncbi:microfibrillar-associated protein 1, partial [Tremellales sp. Uapishka_1]
MAPPVKTPAVRAPKVRYYKGKAPDRPTHSDSDSDDEEHIAVAEPVKVDKRVVAGGAGRIIQQGDEKPKMKLALRDVKVQSGKVLIGGQVPGAKGAEEESSEEEDESEEEETKPAIKPPGSESSEYETDSEEESEEEKKPVFRPTFVRKGARATVLAAEQAEAAAEEAIKKEEEMREQRKLYSKELAGETIRRELAEREAVNLIPDVDDVDGLDPAVEFDEWRARELSRLLRDKEAQALIDEEKEEIERRRALPEEQRLREDEEHARKTREKERTQMGFMEKYYHKGAFHQDDDLLKRDYNIATESSVDMSMLPKVMQVRNFGKMSRTKYTHLADQDTSQGGWGAAAKPGNIGTTTTGCWNCGGPHLRQDCPNNNVNDPSLPGALGLGTSANTAALGMGGSSRG